MRDLLEWDVLDSNASSPDWVSEFELGEPSSVLVDEEVAELSSLSMTFDLLRLMNLGIAKLMLSKTLGAKLMRNPDPESEMSYLEKNIYIYIYIYIYVYKWPQMPSRTLVTRRVQ